jgi:iron(III) transport system permease protein
MFGVDADFFRAILQSILVGALAAFPAFLLGWPAGSAAAIWQFPLRKTVLLLTALPLLLPSFLIAIGLSMLRWGIDGLGGVVWTFAALNVPLVFVTALAAAGSITTSQANAARLAGGEQMLFRLTLRATAPASLLAALFGAVMTMADSGPGMIFGVRTAASELLVTYAAQYDHLLATRQAMTLAVCTTVAALPLTWLLAPRVSAALLARDTAPLEPSRRWCVSLPIALLPLMFFMAPVAGLVRPGFYRDFAFARAGEDFSRTATDTIFFMACAAMISVVAGFALAALVPRRPLAQRIAIVLALMLFALPPVVSAVWLVPWASKTMLIVALALRGLPIAFLFGLRALGSVPSSWSEAAMIHQVNRTKLAAFVTGPWIAPWAVSAGAVVVLLAMAEVSVALLLHPPGHGTFPLAIFTVMANAPEALVASLCLIYVGSVACTGGIVLWSLRQR